MAARSDAVIGGALSPGEDWERPLARREALAEELLALEVLLEEELEDALLLDDELLLEEAVSSSEKSISSLGDDSLGCALSGSAGGSLLGSLAC